MNFKKGRIVRFSRFSLRRSVFITGFSVAALAGQLVNASAAPAMSSEKVSPDLVAASQNADPVTFMVLFKEKASYDSARVKTSRTERATEVVSAGRAAAEKSQSWVRAYLQRERADFEAFWIVNAMKVTGSGALVKTIAARPEVASVDIDRVYSVAPDVEAQAAAEAAAPEWNITNIRAPEVWATGNTGQGVVVSSIDTGVRLNHEALRGRFTGDHGWFDAVLGSASPNDLLGGGTHRMGVMVGANGIGVAPDATWMAAKACAAANVCLQSDLTSAGQFMACPTRPDGTDPDCSKAPQVVLLAFSIGQANPFFNNLLSAYAAIGLIPVTGAGDAGPNCQTVKSPADSGVGVLSAGAANDQNALANFSGRGPSLSGRTKPDIVAPGVAIRSAGNLSNSSYTIRQGTAIAAAHVAGTVALLEAQKPGLSFDQVFPLITGGASSDYVHGTQPCGGLTDNDRPNNRWGAGRLDAAQSVNNA